MCAVNFDAKHMEEQWALGLDVFAPWVGDEDNVLANTGPGKRYPQGPVCRIDGKDVPTYCCASESGSIKSEHLVGMLKSINDVGLFDRNNGPSPFLILDGHGSRFELPFLEYIDNSAHKWNVCIGEQNNWRLPD